jgi:hypothetical protein
MILETDTRVMLTNSSLTTLKTCPRKYQFHYEQGYVPTRESEPLYFGKLMHEGLDFWSKNGRDIEKSVEHIENYWSQGAIKDEYLLAKAVALLRGYHDRYKGDGLETVKSETPFQAPLLNPESGRESNLFYLGGILDRLVRKNGRLKILETKTTSEDIFPESDYWRKLGMDSQVSGYYIGAEVITGEKPETCIYDVIKKPGISPKRATPIEDRKYKKDGTLYATQREKDETPQEYFDRLTADIAERPQFYFARREVPRSASDLYEYLDDAWMLSQTLRTFQLRKKFPRHTNSCVSVYGQCSYFKVCSGQCNIDDSTQFTKVEKVHREFEKVA